MAFLLFWLGSSVFSVGMEAVNELRIVKELADMGYKLNMRKLIGLLQQMELENSRLFFLMLIFPGINMLQGVERRVFYDNIIGGILDYLDDLGVLEEMTAFEKQEYLKEPTKFRALSFSCRSGLNSFLLNSSKPQVKGDNINSDFIFDSLQGIDATSMLEQDEDGIDLFEMILQMGIEQSVVEDNGVSIDSRNGGELLSLFTNEIGILNYFGKHQWFLGDRLCLIRRRKK